MEHRPGDAFHLIYYYIHISIPPSPSPPKYQLARSFPHPSRLLKADEASQACKNDKRTLVTKYKLPYFIPLRSFLGDAQHVLSISEAATTRTPSGIHSAGVLHGDCGAAKIRHSHLRGLASAKARCHQNQCVVFVCPQELDTEQNRAQLNVVFQKQGKKKPKQQSSA